MSPTASLERVDSEAAFAAFEQLVREHIASLPFVLDFQDLERELAEAAEEYGPPTGGAVLARIAGEAVGCAAVRSFDPPTIAELKRMYLRPAARGAGIGRTLCLAALDTARELGYAAVRLDTIAELETANHIYTSLGFRQIEPYRDNPLPSARFYEIDVS